MPRPDEPGSNGREIDEKRLATEILRLLAAPVRVLASELVHDLPKSPEPTEEELDAIEETRQRLAALWIPSPETDTSPHKGYRWPASRLTADDMHKLHKLRMKTNVPISVLMHEAVSIIWELSRSDMAKLLELRQRTGRSMRELLHGAVEFLCDTEEKVPTAQRVTSAGFSTTARRQHSPGGAAALSRADGVTPTEQPTGDTAVGTESPPDAA